MVDRRATFVRLSRRARRNTSRDKRCRAMWQTERRDGHAPAEWAHGHREPASDGVRRPSRRSRSLALISGPSMRTRRAATHVLLALMCGALASSMVMLDAPKAQAAGPTTSQDVERQVAARAALGLPTDPTYVAGVAADSTADTSFGVPLTPAEIADLRARPDAAALDPMVSFARRHPADYGGTYIDQAAGGIVDVAP